MKLIPGRLPARSSASTIALAGAFLGLLSSPASAHPFVPANDAVVLADVPAGTRHTEVATRQIARGRIDVALPLARIYIRQARNTGDLRYLGYAESVLEPWMGADTISADALVLHATILQSRHDFSGALSVLERARLLRPDDAQSWLTTSTVFRVLGRYDEAASACDHLAQRVGNSVIELCRQSVRGLSGSLSSAYAILSEIDSQRMAPEERAWRDSELGEMAVRIGDDAAAERWFRDGLRASPEDAYLRAAYADLLLREQRPEQVLALLKGKEGLEPLLLRIAIAQKSLREPALKQSAARLAAAFAAEAQRGEGIHRREEARFLLDVQDDARAALAAARENWKTQHEVEDVLVLLRSAKAAGTPTAGAGALEFVRERGLEDVRMTALFGANP